MSTAPPPVITPRAGPTSCPANVRETRIALGLKPQADLATVNTVAELWCVTKVNPALMVVNPINEDDAADIGKGDEFPTQTFPTNIEVATALEKYCSSEYMAWLFCFATGNATKTGAAGTGFTYVATPSDPVTQCINLPPFTYAEQIRTPPDSVVDRGAIGMVISDFAITLESGPGRANCRVSTNVVGTGKMAQPTGITPWPTVTPEHFLNAASAAISIIGQDYVLNQSFISAEFRYNNNVRMASGYFPGSGTQNGYAVRGRMEYGTRECTLTFVARAAKGSAEYAALVASPQTEGPVTISVTGAAVGTGQHKFSITSTRAVFSGVVNGEADGIVTVNCTVRFLKPTTGPYISLSATTGLDGVFGK